MGFLEGRCTRGSSCTFSHGDGTEVADDPDDPDMLEIQAAIAKAQGQKPPEDQAMLEHLEDLAEDSQPFPKDDASSDGGDPLPPPASEAEIEEAQRIVQKAQEELAERNKMKAK